MGRRAHRNKTTSISNISISKSVSGERTVTILQRESSKTPAVAQPTKSALEENATPSKPIRPTNTPVQEPPEEIFYMTENGIDLKAMYPDIQLFENAIKYGVGSWYDLGEKLHRLEKSAPKRNIRIIETTEAELLKIRVKEYVDKFVKHIQNMPEDRRTFNALVNLISNNIDQVPEKYRDDVLETICKTIEDEKMYIDSPPPRAPTVAVPAAPEPAVHEPATLEPATLEPAALKPATLKPATLEPATLEPAALESKQSFVLVPLQIVQPHLVCQEECDDTQTASCDGVSYDGASYDDDLSCEAASPNTYELARCYESLDDTGRQALLRTITAIVGYTPELQTTTNYMKRCAYITCFKNGMRSDFLTITDGNLMTVDTLRYPDQQRALEVMNACSKFNNGDPSLYQTQETTDFWSEHYMSICAGWLAASACAFMAFY
jgi:hypothetical protein